ncbi:MAG: gamma-glutamyltransferase [Actinobacteria bacterium]|nr:MAG: gamma-glutamyltransferase [Actinomycetota bacterium]
MRGAVAAGHPLTAEAGARVLREGGNAVDAAVAAALVSWVSESTLTGPGAGGFMLVHRARDCSTRVLDFFVAMPGLGLPGSALAEMEEVDVDFSGGSTQLFRIGAASCAVPGAALGLEEAHRAYGTRPWADLFESAIELARGGVELTRGQAYLHAILDLILRHTSESRAIYERGGERLVAGDLLVQDDLARTLELLSDQGASGGVLIGYALLLLDRLGGAGGGAGSAEAIARLAEVMREQTRSRGGSFTSDLYRGGLVGRLYAPASIGAATRRIERREVGRLEVAGAPGTTHISVVDAAGTAASLTASNGSGSGVVVPGTGIHLNNMLGEFDLPKPPRAGDRLSSGMSPSLVLHEQRPRLVVGSAGSLRLRGAVMQIVVNVVQHGLDVRQAIDRPRVHLEGEHLHCEGGHDPAELDKLEAMGWDVTRWRRRNLFFGGAAAVEMRVDGTLAAAGDPRRGGAGVVVR